MVVCFLRHPPSAKGAPRYYRVEIALNLFGEWSLVIDWGPCGSNGRERIRLFNDLRAASLAADHARDRMLQRGYTRA